MNDVVTTVIVALVPSILMLVINHRLNKMAKRSEAFEAMRQKESFLIMKNIDAIGCLSVQTARCLKGEKPNGELDEALKYQQSQKHDLEDYLMNLAAAMKRE